MPEPDTTYADVVVLLMQWQAIPVYIALIGALSYVAGGLTGLLMFRQWRPYARVGLWNLLTIFAVDLAVWHTRDSRGLHLETRRGKGFWQVEFWLVFTAAFVAITLVFCWLLALPLVLVMALTGRRGAVRMPRVPALAGGCVTLPRFRRATS